jgi:hypothetical protein
MSFVFTHLALKIISARSDLAPLSSQNARLQSEWLQKRFNDYEGDATHRILEKYFLSSVRIRERWFTSQSCCEAEF